VHSHLIRIPFAVLCIEGGHLLLHLVQLLGALPKLATLGVTGPGAVLLHSSPQLMQLGFAHGQRNTAQG
jgi:hypothetical protein